MAKWDDIVSTASYIFVVSVMEASKIVNGWNCMKIIYKSINQMTGWIYFTKQDFTECSATFHSCITHPYNRLCIINPCAHINRITCHHDNDHIRIHF